MVYYGLQLLSPDYLPDRLPDLEAIDQLPSRGGMASMLGTVWLILVALAAATATPPGASPRASASHQRDRPLCPAPSVLS